MSGDARVLLDTDSHQSVDYNDVDLYSDCNCGWSGTLGHGASSNKTAKAR